MNLRSFQIAALACISALLVIASATGCKRDRFELDRLASTEWDPSIAFPLMKANLGVYDIMARIDSSDLFIIDPLTGQVALVYEGQLFSFNAQEVIQLPNQTFSDNIDLSVPEQADLIAFGSISKTVPLSQSFTMQAGVLADSITFLNGAFDVNITSDFMHDGSVQILAPSLVNSSGQTFNETLNLNYTSGPATASISVDMTGYTMDLTAGGTTSNTLDMELELTLVNSGNGFTGSEQVSVDMGFTDLDFDGIYGNFGQQTISLDNDSILIRIFSNSVDGHFQLIDPKLRIRIENSFGFPVLVSIDTLDSRNINTGEVTPLLPGVQPFTINYPSLAQIGQSAQTDTVIDNSNSNIIALMEPTPKYLIHAISATSNPASAPTSYNFLEHDSRFIVDTELELPLVGWADNWFIADTVSFTFEEENIEEIESVELRVIVDNHFPIDARMQIWLLDENYNFLDSIIPTDQDLIRSGVIDQDGRVTQETRTITDIPYSQARVPNLYQARYARVWADAESTDAENETVVRIFDTYYMNFRLGMKVNANLNL